MPTRASLRDQAISALSDGVTAVSGRVHASRFAPLASESNAGGATALPALLVYADKLQRDAEAASVHAVVVVLTVQVVAEATTEAALESSLDSISASVESIILSDSDLNENLEGILQTQLERETRQDADRYAGRDVHQYALRWTEFI